MGGANKKQANSCYRGSKELAAGDNQLYIEAGGANAIRNGIGWNSAQGTVTNNTLGPFLQSKQASHFPSSLSRKLRSLLSRVENDYLVGVEGSPSENWRIKKAILYWLMLKLKLQYFSHLMWRVDSLEKTDAGRDWGQEEKGMTEDGMAGWHQRLNGHEFEWTPGVGDGQGGLACCNSWGRKESDTAEPLNWTELTLYWMACLFSSSFPLSSQNPRSSVYTMSTSPVRTLDNLTHQEKRPPL